MTHVPRWLRILLPAVLILSWLVGASIGGPYFGRVDEVSSNDSTAYLPASADATLVQQRLADFTDSEAIPAVLVVAADRTLGADDLKVIGDRIAATADVEGVAGAISPAIPSEDGRAVQAFVPIRTDSDIPAAVGRVGDAVRTGLPPGVTAYVTGPAGFTADLAAGFAGIDGLLLGVALSAVFLILLVVYRSVLLPIAVLGTSMFALCVALLTVWWLAKGGVLLLSGQTQGILFILVIGAATDYSLLYVSRYREALRHTRSTWEATGVALRGSFEPILASGGTVIAGLLCLLLSDLKSNSTLGPVAAVGIAFAMLAALTFLPALLYAFGRASFWPRRPTYDPEATPADVVPTHGVWARLARGVSRRPRALWVGTAIVLALAAAGATQLRADGVPQSDLVLGASEARDGQNVLGEHFPGGAGSPVYVLADEARLPDVARVLWANNGIESVQVSATGSPTGTLPLTRTGTVGALGAPAGAPAGVTPGRPATGPAPAPKVVEGQVLVQATLTYAADSAEAESTVRALRDELHALPGGELVGGVTATSIDTIDNAIHDRNLIIPVVLSVILLILMVLLRAVIAPVLLIATTVLSFAAALGVSALVFNHVVDFPGADPAVPLYGFVFLVALGIDYNIFLMTRVREETVIHGTREGVLRGLVVTGGVITSAGVVLAATFAALSVIPILFLVQLAFIVAFGVLLDTFVVRSVLVPALVYDIGPAVWWPSKLARGSHRWDRTAPADEQNEVEQVEA
ncbi:putative drug exporter of the RND superfamily [Raineyella antarctica]|uniref:Putative drug exporter of the RND superfamily n=1 Tax=Raineyella antarctica TaxID=1577474 RepID=A0A1G6H9K7_9ACTN|nr:MMPL family transporter [Raineyella antarctica]SDB90126.1 putative drug exporter of the RND superfamily [Raineyella antarctica]